jgi:small-conductance mechanosensitive channel
MTFSKAMKCLSRLLVVAILALAGAPYAIAQTVPAAPNGAATSQQKPATDAGSADAAAKPNGSAPAEATPPPPPPPTLPPEVTEPVEKLARGVESAEKALQDVNQVEGEMVRLRADVERIIDDSRAAVNALRPQLEEVEKQIERLGPPPGKDEPPESAAVAAERTRLNTIKSGIDGAIKTAELAWVRAKQLIDRITVMRYQLFTRNLFERRDSPLSPTVWRNVVSQFPAIKSRFDYYGSDWLNWAGRSSGWLMALGAAIVAVYTLLKLVAGRFVARQLQRPETTPGFFERVFKVAGVAPLRMLAPAVAVAMLYFGLTSLDLVFSPWIGLATSTFEGLLVYIASSVLVTTCLAPGHPAWRLIPLADQTARQVGWLLKAFIAVYVLDTILVELARALYAPLAVTVALSFLTNIAFAVLVGLLILTPFKPQTGPDRAVSVQADPDAPVSLMRPFWIKLPLMAMVVVILASSVLGYVALGRFIASQMVLSGTVIAACGLLYLAVRAATRGRADNRDLVGQTLETRFGCEDASRRRQLSRLVEMLATLVIATAALPLLMLQWGFSGADIRDWLKALLFGFEIGQFRISLARILIGIALFTALLFVTRMVQRWLRDNVLVQPRIDPGIANSVDTAIGYAGVGLALLMALSYAGLDITSLAIVAGALSVGIGFGLQSIVNNFVSGLILLVERPVKVGDWIVVGSEQGNVRRISVRSTEVETFDRASLIIPNSELITGRVLNWTHRSPLGRAVVVVQVAPTADPEQVMKLLLACAEKHPLALQVPAPFVSFDDFNGNELKFTVGVVVADVYTRGKVATELRVAVLKALIDNGIPLPNPQHDVHLKDLGWIKAAAARVIEQQRANSASARSAAAPSGVPGPEA